MLEENELLQEELTRLEGLLAQADAEQGELAGRYHAVSERVSVSSVGPLRVSGQKESSSAPGTNGRWEARPEGGG